MSEYIYKVNTFSFDLTSYFLIPLTNSLIEEKLVESSLKRCFLNFEKTIKISEHELNKNVENQNTFQLGKEKGAGFLNWGSKRG